TNWRRVRQLDVEGSLKQDMLQRGMSAEDIERVIRATAVPDEKKAQEVTFEAAEAWKHGLNGLTGQQLQAKVASDLAIYEMDSEMMEQALEALSRTDLDTKLAVAQAVKHMIDNGAEHEQMRAAIVKLCESSRECCPNRT